MMIEVSETSAVGRGQGLDEVGDASRCEQHQETRKRTEIWKGTSGEKSRR
jgi:hypothetical protein